MHYVVPANWIEVSREEFRACLERIHWTRTRYMGATIYTSVIMPAMFAADTDAGPLYLDPDFREACDRQPIDPLAVDE